MRNTAIHRSPIPSVDSIRPPHTQPLSGGARAPRPGPHGHCFNARICLIGVCYLFSERVWASGIGTKLWGKTIDTKVTDQPKALVTGTRNNYWDFCFLGYQLPKKDVLPVPVPVPTNALFPSFLFSLQRHQCHHNHGIQTPWDCSSNILFLHTDSPFLCLSRLLRNPDVHRPSFFLLHLSISARGRDARSTHKREREMMCPKEKKGE